MLKVDELIWKTYEIAEIDILTERMRDVNVQKIEDLWKPFYRWVDQMDY